jgi:hypothetical protein
MGGFTGAVENIAKSGMEKMESTSVGRGALNLLGNHEWELSLNPEGKAVKSMLGKYEEIRATSLSQANKPHADVWNWMKNDNNARSNFDPKNSTIQDIHDYAVKNKQPIQKSTQKILDMHLQDDGTSSAADKTMKTLSYQNRAKARLDGIAGSFGPKYENLSPILASMQTHPDPRINLNGQRILDIVSNVLHDTQTDYKGAQYSAVKAQVAKAFEASNKFAGTNLDIPKAAPTYYPPTQAEHTYKDILRIIQLPGIILPHLGQYAHLAASAPLSSLTKALFSSTSDEALKMIDHSGIIANSEADILHSDILMRTGKLAQWTNSPTAASIIGKSFHQPGFQWMRLRQLAFTGSVGFHSAIHWAGEAVKGDKRALAELEEMGINPSDVIKQRGQLNESQLRQAIFHFTNNRMFFAKSVDQSLYANRNFFTRSAFMYHSFMNSEAQYFRRELFKMSKAGDIKGIAQFVGTLGVAFPLVAPILKSLEVMARTGNPSAAVAGAQQDYKNLFGGGGIEGFTSTYLDMVSHIGAMGVFRNYLSSIKGHMLLNTMVGPMVGVPASHLQDLGSGAIGTKTGHNFKPLERDVLEDVPLVGRPLAHTLAPTTKEAPKHSFGRTRRHGLRRK